LVQRDPSTFDLPGILQKRDNLRATSNETPYKTTESHLKLKREQIEIITQLQFITNLYQRDACSRCFSDTIVSFSTPVLASRRLSPSVSSVMQFLFLGLTCFIVQNVLSHTSVFPIWSGFLSRNFSIWESYWKMLCLF